MKRLGLLSLMLVLLSRTPAQAQGLPVFDAANLLQNLVQAAQAVLMVANQVLELTGFDALTLGDDYQADLDQLGAIVSDAQGLSYDVASLQAQVTALFSLDTAPASAGELQERLQAIRQVTYESYVYAMRTQTLLQTAQRTIDHLKGLLSAIGGLAGNMQANQTIIQNQHVLNKTVANLQAHTAAFERAQSVERLAEPLTIESLHRINDAVLADWPQ